MKTVLVVFALFVSMNASANIAQCTQTLNNMADLTNDYVTVLKMCRTEPRDSRLYRQASHIARKAEVLFPKLVRQCLQVCGGEADALDFCEGSLDGACQ